MLQIRKSTSDDLKAILDIYNEAVLNTTATFDTAARTFEKQLEWYENHKANHPVFVAEENNVVVGWASLSPYSDRCAYDTTVEVSVYIHPDHRGKKIGSKLLEVITLEGLKVKNHTVISRITSDNLSSIHIHEKIGYRHVGTLKEVGVKFGKLLDVEIMQYLYK
ncbi:MAG: N-acetyltransferase [Bacteroidia bacterium]|nr:N-acetyltransferase [Bacteroidia bacterium]MBP6657522.1 N-acetyltransferase [Bacteroidia bacterium]